MPQPTSIAAAKLVVHLLGNSSMNGPSPMQRLITQGVRIVLDWSRRCPGR